MPDRVGQQLGNYRIIRLLGQGGFAEVYLGVHLYLDTQAAIKVLYTRLSGNEVEQFRQEARTIARLEHPNIMRVLEFGIEDTTPFLVMSYAPNGTLRRRHPKGARVPLSDVVHYVKQVGEALQYAHNENLIHRDIKPENMLLGRRNEVLLSDFGIAFTSNQASIQSVQEIAGTPYYMAPEMFMGKASQASDQYALGVVVYEWLSGYPPFTDGNFIQLGFRHSHELPPPLHEKIYISHEAEQVVLRALAKDPHERFPNIQAFANALEAAYQHAPTVVPGYSEPTNQVKVPDVTVEAPDHTITGTQWSISPPELPKESLLSRGASLLKNLEHHAHEIAEEAAPVIENLGRQGRKFLQKMLESQDANAPSPTPPTASEWAAPRGPSTFLFSSSRLPEDELRDFFISYNRADRSWAEWIAWELKDAGYSFVFPIWDFHKGSNFKLEMQKAAVKAKRTILVLSPNYFDAYCSQSAWSMPFKRNVMVDHETLLPICVRECRSKYRRLLELINYIDIAGMEEEAARAMLLPGLCGHDIILTARPSFPGHAKQRSGELPAERPPFPAILSTIQASKEMLDRALGRNMAPPLTSVYPTSSAPTDQVLIQQIDDAFAKQDWNDVIRKVDLLIKRNTSAVSPEIYHKQGKALLEEGDFQRAHVVLHDALALVVSNPGQRLMMLHDYTTVLRSLNLWDDVIRSTREALRLAPNDPEWLTLQQQALALQQSSKTVPPVVIRPPATQSAHRPQTNSVSQLHIQPSTQNIEAFLSYCREDEKLRNELITYLHPLRRDKGLTIWHDREIGPGKVWKQEVDEHLNTASIILLLISPDFMASEYCYLDEMDRAMKRHDAGEARVIPIILRRTDLVGTPFAKLQALPKDRKPVKNWAKREEAYYDIAQGIRKAVDDLTKGTQSQ